MMVAYLVLQLSRTGNPSLGLWCRWYQRLVLVLGRRENVSPCKDRDMTYDGRMGSWATALNEDPYNVMILCPITFTEKRDMMHEACMRDNFAIGDVVILNRLFASSIKLLSYSNYCDRLLYSTIIMHDNITYSCDKMDMGATWMEPRSDEYTGVIH